jgi:hypothetical protein
MAHKGIFCIEGFWEQGDVMDKASVYPILDLLHRRENIPFTYHRCATKEEILFMLSRWKGAVQKKHPILYFATHGDIGELDFGKKTKLKLEELEEILADKAHNCIFFFGSCFTMKKDKRVISRFLGKTGALAAMGYTKRVDWMKATSAELLALFYLQGAATFDTKGIKEIVKEMAPDEQFFNSLGFRMVECSTRKPRKRTNK